MRLTRSMHRAMIGVRRSTRRTHVPIVQARHSVAAGCQNHPEIKGDVDAQVLSFAEQVAVQTCSGLFNRDGSVASTSFVLGLRSQGEHWPRGNGTFKEAKTDTFDARTAWPHCSSCFSMGCNGGQPGQAWRWFKNTGVVTGGDCTDIGSGTTCGPYSLAPCAHHVEDHTENPVCPRSEYHGGHDDYQPDFFFCNEFRQSLPGPGKRPRIPVKRP